jgi:hypothetical protein
VEKCSQKMWATSAIFNKLLKVGLQAADGQKFAQSGHPGSA